MRNILHHYEIGPVLYCPALHTTIAEDILEEKIPQPFSLCLCLEDTIGDAFVNQAIQALHSTLTRLFDAQTRQEKAIFFPKIYIRVRNPHQIPLLHQKFAHLFALVDGFVGPKINGGNIQQYLTEISKINDKSPCYFMPILENPQLLHLNQRIDFLYEIHQALAPLEPWIPSIRVGGTDLSHCLHLRRNARTSIHEIPVLSHLLSDIIAVFSMDYLVSGVVWEYYGGDFWEKGLKHELKMDKNAGFVGKTVIHPKQIPLVLQNYQVSPTDFQDAQRILANHAEKSLWVEGSVAKERMNEYKTHSHWAEHILLLAQVYGQKEVCANV